jgi:hypothetical protein
MVTLLRLFGHALVPPYHQRLFLRDAQWHPPVLYIVGRDEAEFVARCYGAQMRELVPDLQIKVKKAEPAPAKPAAKPLWKKGKAPLQGDMQAAAGATTARTIRPMPRPEPARTIPVKTSRPRSISPHGGPTMTARDRWNTRVAQGRCGRCGRDNPRKDTHKTCLACREFKAEEHRQTRQPQVQRVAEGAHLKYPTGIVCALNRDWMRP